MKRRISKTLVYIVQFYVLIALAWWTILLHKKNNELFQADKLLLEQKFNTAQDLAVVHIEETSEFKIIQKKYLRQNFMILGEGFVFALSLITGIWFIGKVYRKDVEIAENQKNFLLSITHELKSPLASIKLALDTFVKRKLSQDQINELAITSNKEVERLNGLVNNLLLGAKVDGQYIYHFEETDLSNLIESIILDYKRKNSEFEFITEYENNLKLIMVDKETLQSAFYNLIENAIKYGNGSLKVSVRQKNDDVIIDFRDKGAGILKENWDKVFNKFYRIGSEETRKSKGTGLGLFIVKRIIEAHKGNIFINESDETGTNFRITMPINQ